MWKITLTPTRRLDLRQRGLNAGFSAADPEIFAPASRCWTGGRLQCGAPLSASEHKVKITRLLDASA
jgi:hypothetical protein